MSRRTGARPAALSQVRNNPICAPYPIDVAPSQLIHADHGIPGRVGSSGYHREIPLQPHRTSTRVVQRHQAVLGLRVSSASLDSYLAICHNSFVLDIDLIKALGNEKRLQVLEWLRDPVANFPPQRDGDLVKDGVCALFIAEKLGVSAPTCGEHLRLLSQAGLIRGKKIKQWVFYKRDEDRIAQAKETLASDW